MESIQLVFAWPDVLDVEHSQKHVPMLEMRRGSVVRMLQGCET